MKLLKIDINDFVEKTDFDIKLKIFKKKLTSNETKHVDDEKKTTDLTIKVGQISEEEYDFLLVRIRMYFTGDDGYQNFLVFAPMLSSLILDSNKKVTKWTST